MKLSQLQSPSLKRRTVKKKNPESDVEQHFFSMAGSFAPLLNAVWRKAKE